MISRRERFEILKIAQGLSERVVAVDDGQAKPMRPNTILRALKKTSLVALAKVIFGRPSSTSFGLNRASGRQPSYYEARRLAANVASLQQ
jgi:hypothetical protein